MATSQYARGVAVERRAVAALEQLGYLAQRAASSKGMWDIYSVNADRVYVVSCKRTATAASAKKVYSAEKKKLTALLEIVPKDNFKQGLWIWADTLPEHPRGGWWIQEEI